MQLFIFANTAKAFPVDSNLFSFHHFHSLSKCQYFEQTFELPQSIEFILVQCKGSHSKDVEKKKAKTVYSNAHAIVRRKPQIQKVFDSFKTLYPTERPLSVLMMGIDSVSRLNLIRAMPNTAQHLYDSGWFELKGYNKVNGPEIFLFPLSKLKSNFFPFLVFIQMDDNTVRKKTKACMNSTIILFKIFSVPKPDGNLNRI